MAKIFTRLAKEITMAAKSGGTDPDNNPRLRALISNARSENMPKDNIEKAILKGAGELPGVVYEEVVYEGYGPGGSAIVVECLTDNTNRTVQFVRSAFTKHGGSLGGANSVLYMFQRRGVIRISAENLTQYDSADVELYAIDAGAEDIFNEPEGLTIYTTPEQLETVRAHVAQTGIVADAAGIELVSSQHMHLSDDQREKFENLIEVFEENEDVQAVYSNVR